MNFPRLVLVQSRWSATLGAGCLALLVALSGCGTKPTNEYADWAPEKLFSEAKAEQEAGNYEKASKMFEALEGKGAGTLMSQQALLEGAYLRYLQGERATALSTIERFIKLYPSSPAVDYALYLKGLINFNDDLGFMGKLSRQDLSEARSTGRAGRFPILQAIGRAVPGVALHRRCAGAHGLHLEHAGGL